MRLYRGSIFVSLSPVTSGCSAHQGWTTHPHEGSQSWFELILATPSASAAGDKEAQSLPDLREKTIIRSHEHGVYMKGLLQKHSSGDKFALYSDAMARLWENAEEGDVLFVKACAKNAFWKNRGEGIGVKAWVRYEPEFNRLERK